MRITNRSRTCFDTGPVRSWYSQSSIFYGILIVLICLFSYSNTYHVPFQFDDPYNITEKPYVRDIGAFFDSKELSPDSSFIMRKVGYFTFAVNYWLHGDNVVGYHIVNIAIHTLNGFLVYFLVLLTFRTPYLRGQGSVDSSQEKGTALIALFTALLFVSHPVQTQAITYIVQRLASLATFFYLLSLVMYIKWRLLLEQKRGSAEARKALGSRQEASVPISYRLSPITFSLSLLSVVLAMKTKEIAFTLPLVIALYEFMFFEGSRMKRFLYLFPLLLTMFIIPMDLIGLGKPTGEVIGDVSEATRIGSPLSRWDYLFTQLRVIVTYIRLLFFPVNQNLDYDYPVYSSFFTPPVFLSFLFLLSIFGAAVYLLLKSRQESIGDRLWKKKSSSLPITYHLSPIVYYRLIAFGIFWFFITLSVESSIIPIADVIFEHRLYLPSAGFFITVAAAVFLLVERSRSSPGKTVIAVFGIFVVVFSGLTYLRNNAWRSEVNLWEDVIRKSPMKPRGYNGLGLAYQKEGQVDKSLENFTRAVRLNPYYAVGHNSLGTVFFKKNLPGMAVEEFTRAISLEPANAIFYNNRGLVYAAMGEIDRAAADYIEALSLDSSYAEAYHNLGSVFHGKGLYEKAVGEYTKAMAIEADNAVYYNNRGLSYAAIGEFDKAIADYTKAIALKPEFAEAYMGRGIASGETGRLDQAVADFSTAIYLDPSNASVYVNRAVAYERMQNTGMALSDFQRACEIGDERGCNGVVYIKKKYRVGD